MNKDNNTNDWRKYHEAWQKYYQEYYGKYYLNAAKEYVARETARVRAERASEAGKFPAEDESAPKIRNNRGGFKERIQNLSSEKREKLEKRRRFLPILAGVAVMLTLVFLQYNRLIFAPIYAYVAPGKAPAAEISAVDPTVTLTRVSEENKLIIPKLNVDVPVIYGVEYDDVMEAMNHGVSHYRISGASAYPGEIGNFVITGHSAGDIYSSNPYKFIFSGLERLEQGDLLYIHYNGTRYTYRMTKREVIEPTEVSKLIYETDKPVMTLITCYPLGTSRQRLLITAEQISPSYGNAVAETGVDTTVETMPKNEKTFGERVLEFLGL